MDYKYSADVVRHTVVNIGTVGLHLPISGDYLARIKASQRA